MATAGTVRETAKKGPPKGGGSRKGRPNKVTADLRQMMLNALDSAGGEKYLTTQAKANPGAFMAMLGKCLPKDVKIEGDLSMTVTVQRLSEGAK